MSSLEELRPDDIEELAAKGRGRIGRVLSNARVVGHLTIAMGRRTIEAEVRRWRPPTASEVPAEEPAPRPTGAIGPTVVTTPSRRGEPNANLAIPGYEALSASQVVKRLDGLGPEELEAIYEHEASARRRRTILHRTQQLLGREDTPGPASWPA